MLAAATTATTTIAAANTASIAALTANIRNNSNNNGNNNMQTKKIVLYNPSVDYSAPLQQQINPDIIGAHPHAQHYQQQCSASSGGGVPTSATHNTNQVRQPLQPLQQLQQQQTQQQPRLSAFAPVAAARLSLAGLAAAAAPTPSAQTSAGISSTQQKQQQQQQLQLQQQMLATLALPLKLSEQCNLSNLHLNSFANEMGPIKSGLEQQQQQHNNNMNNNQVVGLLGRNVGANGLLANNSVGSSISNLLISNNLTTTATTAAAAATTAAATTTTSAIGIGDGAMSLLPVNSKLNALWGQPQAAYSHSVGNTGAGNLFNNPANTSDPISTLWGCSSSSASSGASSTSGCSSGSGSQPSLSPTSTTSTRPDYRSNVSNGKEPLWLSTQQTSPNSSNTLRDTYYTTTKAGVAITAANVLDGGINGGANNTTTESVQQSTSPSATSTCSSTSSSASSTCSSGVGSNTALDIGTWPNCKLQNYFAVDNCNANTVDDVAHFAKINNIWDIPNAAASTTARTADLFTDLWCNNADNSTATVGTRVNNNTNTEFELSGDSIDFNDASSIWRTNITAGAPAAGAQPKQLATTTIAGNNNKAVRANLATDANNGAGVGTGVGAGVAAENESNGTACMQLFSEQFLNYINIMNYTD